MSGFEKSYPLFDVCCYKSYRGYLVLSPLDGHDVLAFPYQTGSELGQ